MRQLPDLCTWQLPPCLGMIIHWNRMYIRVFRPDSTTMSQLLAWEEMQWILIIWLWSWLVVIDVSHSSTQAFIASWDEICRQTLENLPLPLRQFFHVSNTSNSATCFVAWSLILRHIARGKLLGVIVHEILTLDVHTFAIGIIAKTWKIFPWKCTICLQVQTFNASKKQAIQNQMIALCCFVYRIVVILPRIVLKWMYAIRWVSVS